MNNKGQVFIMSLVIITVFLILIPLNVFLLQQETKHTIREKRSSVAFQMAEAGIERGYWKLKETAATWDNLVTATISGYNFDTVYKDIPSRDDPIGEYVIKITSHTTKEKFRIVTAVGRDLLQTEICAIEAIYEKGDADLSETSIKSGAKITENVSINIHWGKLSALDMIDLGVSSGTYYPRKYSSSKILPRDDNAQVPNTDGTEWWSYYDVPSLPQIDLSWYQTQANAQGNYYTSNKTWNNKNFDTGEVYYFTKNLTLGGNTYIRGTIIVLGKLTTNVTGGENTTVYVPRNAWQEYGIIDTSDLDEYPADIGLNASGVTYEIPNLNINGFVYVGKTATIRDTNIYGVLMAQSNVSLTNTVNIYFGEEIANDVRIITTDYDAINRTSWRKIHLDWPL